MIMKRILFFLISSLFWIAGELQAQTDSYVEVLYFHGKQRCITCEATKCQVIPFRKNTASKT